MNHAPRILPEERAAPGYYETNLKDRMFPPDLVLVPQIRQIYELDLAVGEYEMLERRELVPRAAYFESVDGQKTHHFSICTATPSQVNTTASQRRKSFFDANQFAVGYATHGLFPYRGKFHPQMIRAVLNIIGLKPGDTVLDVLAGCGTTNIEAAIMGIDSVAVELNPFACLMIRAKTQVLDTDVDGIGTLRDMSDALLAKFDGQSEPAADLFGEAQARMQRLEDLFATTPALQEFSSLCYLDAMGYAHRRKGKTVPQLLPDMIARYVDAAEAFNRVRQELGLPIGRVNIRNEDARHVVLRPASVDGIVFSPPYSFAIDYLENDRLQLEYLACDIDALSDQMIGLRGSQGSTKQQRVEAKLHAYFEDMRLIMAKCSMALKKGKSCVVVVGSNTNQTGGIRLEQRITELADDAGLHLYKHLVRLIEGIRNTMRDEHLLFFRKV